MTNKNELPSDVLDAMSSLVEYLEKDEEKNYEETYTDSDGNIEQGRRHIYTDIVTIKKFIERI